MIFERVRHRIKNSAIEHRRLMHILIGPQPLLLWAVTFAAAALLSVAWIIFFGTNWSFCARLYSEGYFSSCLVHSIPWRLLAPLFFLSMATFGIAVRMYFRAEAALKGTHESLYSLLHDLKSPIASSYAHLDALMQKEKATREDLRYLVSVSHRELSKASALLGEMAELTHLHGASRPLAFQMLSISDVAHEALRRLMPFANGKRISLKVEEQPSLPVIPGNVGALERVISNIAENAIRHTPPAGSITIGLRRKGRWMLVTISDTGKGMSRAETRLIFERFYQGKLHGSSGLGLTICKQLIEAHGGSISVKSTLGIGTCFSIWLPLR